MGVISLLGIFLFPDYIIHQIMNHLIWKIFDKLIKNGNSHESFEYYGMEN